MGVRRDRSRDLSLPVAILCGVGLAVLLTLFFPVAAQAPPAKISALSTSSLRQDFFQAAPPVDSSPLPLLQRFSMDRDGGLQISDGGHFCGGSWSSKSQGDRGNVAKLSGGARRSAKAGRFCVRCSRSLPKHFSDRAVTALLFLGNFLW
jgi:hypothetical protein